MKIDKDAIQGQYADATAWNLAEIDMVLYVRPYSIVYVVHCLWHDYKVYVWY